MSEVVIKVNQLSKAYRIWADPQARLAGSLSSRLCQVPGLPTPMRRWVRAHADRSSKKFLALNNISFEVYRGETVGIIGRNGSGKSTTLKIITGTVQPTSGTVEVNGRVSALLELGAGFDPEFTGRENVFLSAAILGMNRAQTEAKFDEIAAFADIGEFLDQPIKTYSSGMMVRLAFAVYTALDPEILIIDEALSVGDETFRRKCFSRLERLREDGKTLLFVSHDLSSVMNLTRRALLFHRGEIILHGRPKYVVGRYTKLCNAPDAQVENLVRQIRSEQEGEESDPTASAPPPSTPHTAISDEFDPHLQTRSALSYDQHGAEIHSIEIFNESGEKVNLLRRRQHYTLRYRVSFSRDARDVSFAMCLKTIDGLELGGARSLPLNSFLPMVEAGTSYLISFRFRCLLMPGVYFVNTGVEGQLEEKRSYVHRLVDATVFRVQLEENPLPTAMIDFLIEPEVELCLTN